MATEDDTEALRSALCMKEHETYALRAELERRNLEVQMLTVSIERVERTMAAGFDRIARKLDRRRH